MDFTYLKITFIMDMSSNFSGVIACPRPSKNQRCPGMLLVASFPLLLHPSACYLLDIAHTPPVIRIENYQGSALTQENKAKMAVSTLFLHSVCTDMRGYRELTGNTSN